MVFDPCNYWYCILPASPATIDNILDNICSLSHASIENIGGFATKTDETMENVHKIDFLAFLSPGRREKHWIRLI